MKKTTANLALAALAAFSTAAAAQTPPPPYRQVPVNIGGMTCVLYAIRPVYDAAYNRFTTQIGVDCPAPIQLVNEWPNIWLTRDGVGYHQDPTVFYTFGYQNTSKHVYVQTSLSCKNKPTQPVTWLGTGYIRVKYNGVVYRNDITSDGSALVCDYP